MPTEALKAQLQPAIKADVEDYPRIIQKITLFWGHEGFNSLITQLTMIEESRVNGDNTAGYGGRTGFPPPVMHELIMLQEVHSILHPELAQDNWGLAPR